MSLLFRMKSAVRKAALHLAVSSVVAALVAWVVLRLWYPAPYDQLSSGRNLFFLLILVDVACGPLLTLLVFNPEKSKFKWRFNLAVIVVLQLCALSYGLHASATARPVFLAFEGNRFRVVQANDVDPERLKEARPEFTTLSLTGPRLVGTRLAQPTDADFPASLQLALNGLPPAFRPARWVPYPEQEGQVLKELKPLSELRAKNPDKSTEINSMVRAGGMKESQLGYLPLVNDEKNDWVVVVSRHDALPKAYLHIDGW